MKRYDDLDFCDPRTHDNPAEMYAWFREHRPLYWDRHNELYFVFRLDDVVEISKDAERFTSSEGNRPNLPGDPSMINQDGEQHRAQRGIVAEGFSPKRIRRIETEIRAIAEELVAELLERKAVDLVRDFANVIPMRVIAGMLGVPRERESWLLEKVETFVGGGQGPAYVTDEVNAAFDEFVAHHETMVAEREACPGADILSLWLDAEINGQKLDESQLLFEHTLMTVGGSKTTRAAIAGGLLELAARPDDYRFLSDNRKALPNAMEEVLRWVTPFVNMFRTTTREVELHGVRIEAGRQIGLVYPAANRDPRHFDRPETFDIHRDFRTRHVAFGHGSHFCLGATLARLEMKIAFETFFDHVEHIELAASPTWISSSFVRGLSTLPVVLHPRRAARVA